MLIALILFGLAVIAVAAVAALRSSRTPEMRETRNLDPEGVEREIYEKLYGKRSGTVSDPLPAKPPIEDPPPRELSGDPDRRDSDRQAA